MGIGAFLSPFYFSNEQPAISLAAEGSDPLPASCFEVYSEFAEKSFKERLGLAHEADCNIGPHLQL